MNICITIYNISQEIANEKETQKMKASLKILRKYQEIYSHRLLKEKQTQTQTIHKLLLKKEYKNKREKAMTRNFRTLRKKCL